MIRGILRSVLASSLLVSGIGAAQAANTGTLIVRAIDKEGRPVPGIVVEIRSARGNSAPPARQSDPEGRAAFVLTSGPGYVARVSGAGFATQSSEEFDMPLGGTRTLVFTLREEIVEKVQVRSKVVDLDEGGEKQFTISDTFAQDLPVLGRSYQNLLTLAPGVNDADKDGNPNVHGSRARDFKATVDGISNVDPLTGSYMSNINPDAIEEVEIVTTGASAEYGGAVGGFGKVITKQGTNVLSGSGSVYIRSSVFDGGTVGTGTDSGDLTYHDVRPSLNVTGPFLKDKLFFALFHEYIDQGEPQNLLGGAGYVIVTQGSRNLDKVTWQASPANKLVFQVQSDPIRISPLGIERFTRPESGYAYKQGGPTYQVHWDAQPSSVFSIQSLAGLSDTGISLVPETSGTKNGCVWDESAASVPSSRYDPFGMPGGEPIDEDYCFTEHSATQSGSYYREYSDQRVRYTFKTDASYYLENFLGTSHTVKAGLVAEKKRYSGQQSLRSSSNWEQAPPTLANGGVRGSGQLFRTVYYPGLPDRMENTASGSSYGLYLEDLFRPHPNVSLRIGLRVDQENLTADGYQPFDPAEEDRAFIESYNACVAPDPDNADRCARINFRHFHMYEVIPSIGASPVRSIMEDPTTRVKPRKPESLRISNTNLAPRFSISWDPAGDAKTKLFGTAGRYYGEIFLAVPAYEQGPDSFVFDYPVYPEPTNCRPDPVVGVICDYVSVVYPDNFADVAPASIRQIDRNLNTPFQDEYTAGFSREIFQETSITVTRIRRRYRDQLQDVDVNHFAVRDSDGDVVGVTAHNPFFNEILLIGNYNESDYDAWELELRRRLYRDWELEASYVWSKATGNGEDFDQTLGNDPARIDDEFGYLDYDQRHVAKLNARTQVPSWNMRFSSALSWQSGRPYSIVQEGFVYDLPRYYGNTQVRYGQTRATFPTGERNDQRNEDYWNLDLGARKDFPVGKASVEVSFDVFNVLNDDALYIQEVRNGRNVGIRNTGRQFQVGAKIAF